MTTCLVCLDADEWVSIRGVFHNAHAHRPMHMSNCNSPLLWRLAKSMQWTCHAASTKKMEINAVPIVDELSDTRHLWLVDDLGPIMMRCLRTTYGVDKDLMDKDTETCGAIDTRRYYRVLVSHKTRFSLSIGAQNASTEDNLRSRTSMTQEKTKHARHGGEYHQQSLLRQKSETFHTFNANTVGKAGCTMGQFD